MIIRALRAVFDFRGRTRRRTFWLFVAAWFVPVTVSGAEIDRPESTLDSVAIAAFWVMYLVVLLVAIRRLHDTNRRGWWILLGISGLGLIYVLVLLSTDSTPGPNRFGADPKGRPAIYEPPAIHYPAGGPGRPG
ncbi:DUF805 domain-containing protein [Kribbella antibiotica]|uniref:DUF805 domain-containing protein n=1 Tax=Kribbella antibiotica TaxID=190195 RepID=UPI0014048F30|nr:DUF805 domain-containing protein [Kribbella antibiotica]